jgi:hypothetical protein
MPIFDQTYSLNSLYVFGVFLLYHVCYTNYYYINIILSKLYLLNIHSLVILLNIVGLYLFLKNVYFEVNFKFSVKYMTK